MKLAASNKESPQDSKGKRFGFGYEEKSKNSPSTRTARAEFLKLIPTLGPRVVFDLFATAYQTFCELLAANEGVIAALCESLESEIPEEAYILRQPKFIRERAIKTLLPNYRLLQQVEGATPLRQALERWGLDHNLSDDWCLDHALASFQEFDGSDDKNLAFALWRNNQDPHYLLGLAKESWSWAVHDSCDPLGAQFESNMRVEEYGGYSFSFVHESLPFSVTGPFFKSPAKFKQEVEDRFKALGGPAIRGARKALKFQLGEYREQVAKARRDLNLEAPPVRWAEDHFRWLIKYQVPPCMKYREIAKEIRKNDKTVSEGIQDVARLLGLTLRSSEQDKHSGRPKGVRETTPRRRATRNLCVNAT
jgi:hypothetical protein